MTDYERIRERLEQQMENWKPEEFAKRSEREWARQLEGTDRDTPENRLAIDKAIIEEVKQEANAYIEAELAKFNFNEDGYLIEEGDKDA